MLASADIKAEEAGPVERPRDAGRAVAAGRFRRNPKHDSRTSNIPLRARKGGFARRRRTGGLAGGKEDAITTPQNDAPRRDRGDRPGKLYAVGIGPGGRQHRTYRAVEAIGRKPGDRRLYAATWN